MEMASRPSKLMEAMIVCNEQQFDHRPNFRPSHRNNLTHNELQALNEPCNNKDIVIEPVDKGSAVVIMQRADYRVPKRKVTDN